MSKAQLSCPENMTLLAILWVCLFLSMVIRFMIYVQSLGQVW